MTKKIPILLILTLLFHSNYAIAQTISSGFSDIGTTSDAPIEITSEELEILDNENKAIFRRDVIATQGDTTLQTKVLTVYYQDNEEQNSQSISKFEVSGGVLVTSKNQEISGDAGKFEYETNTLELTGERVVLTEGSSVAVGKKLIVYIDTGRLLLLGEEKDDRIRILIDPNDSTSTDSSSN